MKMPRRLREERGQMLIMFVGIFTIIAVAAAITVDFGLWFSERRGAQKDADVIALAAAYELLHDDQNTCDTRATNASVQWATDNDLNPADDIHNFSACTTLAFPADYAAEPRCKELGPGNGRPNAVYLDIDHETRALFAGILGVGAPEVGAHACVRAGSLTSGTGIRPWAVPIVNNPCFGIDSSTGNPEPLFGATCVFRDEGDESHVGSIRLGGCPSAPGPGSDAPCPEADSDAITCGPPGGGANQYEENIVYGSPAECSIGDLVTTQPGLDVGPTFTALEQLLANEGECDDENGDGDGIDQFGESFVATSGSTTAPGPGVTFSPHDCDTPRAIHIIIVDQFNPPGAEEYTIQGFAAFFLEQCEVVDPGDQGDPDDDVIVAVYEDCAVPPGDRPNAQIRGFFMSILELEGDIGDFDEFGTKVIRLVE